MAALLLRQGRPGSLKTMLLEGRVFRGLAAAVSLSTESGKSDKELPPNPKKQSPPKNVVEPNKKGKLLTTPAAAELSKNVASPSSYSSVVNRGRTVAGPSDSSPSDNVQFTDAGLPAFLSRKTSVEFPQKVPPSFEKQGSEALGKSRKGTGAGSKVDSQVTSTGRGKGPKPGVSRAFENRAPQISISAKEKTWSPQPHLDLPSPEKPRQTKKKATPTKPLKDRKDTEPKPTVPKSQVDEELLKQTVKEKKLQKVFRSNKIEKESQEPFEVKKTSSDHTKSGLSAQPKGGLMPPQLTEEVTAGRRLQATPPETRGRHPEDQAPEPDGDVAFPLFKKESLGKQVIEGTLKAKEGTLEDQGPIKNLKPVPVQNKEVFEEEIPVLKLEAKGGTTEDAASQVDEQAGAQEPAQAAAPPEPFDNTTYKNLQHHDYTPYTFLDLNLNLAKFRQPQPSSGRESPRH
ncbi:NADH dehydrogenase [ubiquinone] flavoprotein 3, mitochondrial isoform 2-T2 [Hipposideros larvatus]